MSGNHFMLPYQIECRPSPDFHYEQGKKKLANLQLSVGDDTRISFITPGDNDSYDAHDDIYELGYTGRRGNALRLSARIDMESRLTIGCAGALLTYIGRRKSLEYVGRDTPAAGTLYQISIVKSFTLQGMMWVLTLHIWTTDPQLIKAGL